MQGVKNIPISFSLLICMYVCMFYRICISGRTKSSPSDNFYSFNPVVVFKSVFVGSEISHSIPLLCANSFLLGAKSLVYFFSLSIRYYVVVCKSDFVLGVISPLQSRRVQICFYWEWNLPFNPVVCKSDFVLGVISPFQSLCVKIRFCSERNLTFNPVVVCKSVFVRREISRLLFQSVHASICLVNLHLREEY